MRVKILLRTALNVIFGIYPTPDDQENAARELPSLADRPSMSIKKVISDGNGRSVDVEFGDKIDPSRYREYQLYSLKASAWISIALRKLKLGRHLVKKWFV